MVHTLYTYKLILGKGTEQGKFDLKGISTAPRDAIRYTYHKHYFNSSEASQIYKK